MPEQEPHVGHADRSISSEFLSDTFGSAPATIASTKSNFLISLFQLTLPASIGPPETKTTGILILRAAISIPGVILSQLDIQTMASAQ